MKRLFKQFSFPGGIPSHVAPETPGSIHEGGELGYFAGARVRRGVRQSRSDRRLRDRRRRSGDRAARDELAFEQVPQPGARRRGAADSASERLQDRRPDGAGAHSARRARRQLFARLRLRAVLRRRRRPGADASADGRDARHASSPKSSASRATRARDGFEQRPRVADDRAAHAERLDRPEGRRRRSQSKARFARTRCRSPNSQASPKHLKILEQWMKSYRPEELFDTQRQAHSRNWPNWRRRASDAWAPILTPTADCCCAI